MSAPLEPGTLEVGNVPIARMRAAINELRAACRAEGTDRIQAAIDSVEEWIDPIFCTEAPSLTLGDVTDPRLAEILGERGVE